MAERLIKKIYIRHYLEYTQLLEVIKSFLVVDNLEFKKIGTIIT